MTQCHHFARLAGHGDAQASCDVLTKVDDGRAGRGLPPVDRLQAVGRTNRWGRGRYQTRHVVIDLPDHTPLAGGKGGFQPAHGFAPCVMDLSVVQAGAERRPEGADPRRVRAEPQPSPGLDDDIEFGQQRQIVAIDVRHPTVEPEPAAEPTVGQHRSDHILPGTEECTDLVCAVGEPVWVTGPTRSENLVTYPSAIDEDVVDPQGGDAEGRVPHGAGDFELSPQQRTGAALRRPRSCGDEPCAPTVGRFVAHHLTIALRELRQGLHPSPVDLAAPRTWTPASSPERRASPKSRQSRQIVATN